MSTSERVKLSANDVTELYVEKRKTVRAVKVTIDNAYAVGRNIRADTVTINVQTGSIVFEKKQGAPAEYKMQHGDYLVTTNSETKVVEGYEFERTWEEG